MSNAIWKVSRSVYIAHCIETADARRIASWQGAELGAEYYYPDRHREMDVIIPGRLYNRAARLLGLPEKKKSPNRILAGKKQAQSLSEYRFSRRLETKSSPLAASKT